MLCRSCCVGLHDEQTRGIGPDQQYACIGAGCGSNSDDDGGRSFSGCRKRGHGVRQAKDWNLPRKNSTLKIGHSSAARCKSSGNLVTPELRLRAPSVVERARNGFDFQLLDRGGLGHQALMDARNQLLDMVREDKRLVRVRPNGLEDVAQYRVDVDWEKAGALGVPVDSIHTNISAAFGSAYVNDFIHGGRVKRVYVQADAPYRMMPEDLTKFYLRNNDGKMTPFSSFATGYWTYGPPKLERFNASPSINILGEPATGHSSGEAMRIMEQLTARLPRGIGYDWTGLSYQERQAGAQTTMLYAFSILVIFLCLAALYESWPVPISILLALPLGVIGGVIATTLRDLPNDVYFQIGLLTTLGLTTKNAILIVQFAKARLEEGMSLREATLEAARLRLRPIVMTSLAFGFGVLPLTLASGAGAGAQKAIGTGVMGGVVTSTFLVTIFAPLFYVLIEKTFGKSGRRQSGR